MKQLVVIADMEGASGIFDWNADAMAHGSQLWREYGRTCLTSDVLAVCEAANQHGIDSIMLYDGHYAGNREFNVLLEELPSNVRVFDTPERRFLWRRIRGQAAWEPYGLVTAGQHARYGEPDAYFAHTIQSPPIKSLSVNGKRISELGQAALSFRGTKYVANIGCAASHREAIEVCDTVSCITVKSKRDSWEPACAETHPIIREAVAEALNDIERKRRISIDEPCQFSMELMEGYCFDIPSRIAWKGSFDVCAAFWEAPGVEIGLELLGHVRSFVRKRA